MTFQESYSTFSNIFLGKYSDIEIEKILRTLSQQGETFEEIAGAAKAMRESALLVPCSKETFDVCGTGGSGSSKPFNISTTSALILASQGVCTAKHGNRKASSCSGSADVLEELGIRITQTPEEMSASLEKNNMAFLFAQVLHPKMKDIMPIRKKIGTKTIFNLLGPLTNPSNPTRQVVGVSSKQMLEPMAKALQLIGKKSSIVLHGEDGLDDATITGKTFFARFTSPQGVIETGEFSPQDFGLIPCSARTIQSGNNPAENAEIINNILNGSDAGPRRDIVLLNAGVGFRESQKTASIEEGIALAEKAIINGDAFRLLKTLQKEI